jgi:hypothetical protein
MQRTPLGLLVPPACLQEGRLPVLLVRPHGPRQQPHLVGPDERISDLPLGLRQMDERCTSRSGILHYQPERPTQSLSPRTSVVLVCTCLFSHARDHLLAQSTRSTRRYGGDAMAPGRNGHEQEPPALPLVISSDHETDARRLRRSPNPAPTPAQPACRAVDRGRRLSLPAPGRG